MPHIHLLIGIIFVNSLQINSFSNILLILGAILPDADIILGVIQKRNHRTYLSHYPISWIFFTILALILKSNCYWFFLGGIIHVFSDIIDWKVFIFAPFSDYSVSLLNLNPNEVLSELSPKKSILSYYQQPQILFIETLTFLLGLFSFIWN